MLWQIITVIFFIDPVDKYIDPLRALLRAERQGLYPGSSCMVNNNDLPLRRVKGLLKTAIVKPNSGIYVIYCVEDFFRDPTEFYKYTIYTLPLADINIHRVFPNSRNLIPIRQIYRQIISNIAQEVAAKISCSKSDTKDK